MNRKIEKIVKTYFYFNSSERKSIITLIVLIILCIALPQVYFKLFPIEKAKIQIIELKEQEANFFNVNQTSKTEKATSLSTTNATNKFDPNTASDEELTSIGFSSKNIRTIRNYQAKGGNFKTAEDLKKKITNLKNDLKNSEEFKKMYKFVYDFARDKSFKNLQMEVALDLWELLLAGKCRFLQDWIEFLKTEKRDLQVVQKDTWNMLLELIESTGGDFTKF
jgi:hypothetical protein